MMNDRDRRVILAVNHLVSHNIVSMPVNVVAICHAYGVQLISASDYMHRGLDPTIIFEVWGNSDGTAFSNGNSHVINYNDNKPLNRQRFTIAEEFMHIVLGHTRDARFNVFLQSYTEEVYAMYEREAKHGAAMLLMPPSLYFRLRARYDLDQLAKLCHISNACAWTAAQYYMENEDELRELFTQKIIICNTDAMRPRSFHPLSVWPSTEFHSVS